MYKPQVHPRGPANAKILIVGEAPGANEVQDGVPFVGQSGQELMKMLQEAGIDPTSVRYTNVVNVRPPNNKIDQFFRTSKKKADADGAILHNGKYAMPIVFEGIEALKKELMNIPNIVVPCGNVALWALTGNWGIMKWRSSEMYTNLEGVPPFKCVPCVHPAMILRRWDWRWIAVHDFKRVAREAEYPDVRMPDYRFLVRPSYRDVVDRLIYLISSLDRGPRKLAVDIETRLRHMACVGIAWSPLDALCIPLMCVEDDAGYWSLEEETEIWWLLYQLLTHPNCHVVGQNFLYDNQYFARRAGFACNLQSDTMIKHHVIFPGVSKGLDFLSSFWNEHHCYWKDEGKEWDITIDEEQYWIYNCKDAVATYEADGHMDAALESFGLTERYTERLRTARVAFRMMLRGVPVDKEKKAQLSMELAEAILQRRDWLEYVIGFSIFGPKGVSSKKMMQLCYDVLQLPKKFKKTPQGTRLTADKDAVKEWIETCEPLFRPILEMISEIRSLGVFKSTFADAGVDLDGNFRCSMNIAGPVTFRWSTSEDAFGFGTNMQNIPKGDEDD